METGPAASSMLLLITFSCLSYTNSAVVETPIKYPRLVSRADWGALPPVKTSVQQVPVSFVVLHHGGIKEYCENITTCSQQARNYQELHMNTRGWDDIGYSFLVGEDGNVYEGRSWHRVGAHAPQYNNQSIGICIIGDFSDRLPNKLALDAVKGLIEQGVQEKLLIANYTLLGHRQARETLCPGEALYQEITTWPHWDSSPSPRKYCTTCSTVNKSGCTKGSQITITLLFIALAVLTVR